MDWCAFSLEEECECGVFLCVEKQRHTQRLKVDASLAEERGKLVNLIDASLAEERGKLVNLIDHEWKVQMRRLERILDGITDFSSERLSEQNE